eukprot:TRINITY_DN88088_c0_g1_i1.p1 TRINITY_DN88088_c0_g1~~TRINITY_DN88088_c0_g1_i1.p1  ORF type:complete len:334 (+),score=18.14 TRINITY_DN88088_c0_g1_i1:104-1105(+)
MPRERSLSSSSYDRRRRDRHRHKHKRRRRYSTSSDSYERRRSRHKRRKHRRYSSTSSSSSSSRHHRRRRSHNHTQSSNSQMHSPPPLPAEYLTEKPVICTQHPLIEGLSIYENAFSDRVCSLYNDWLETIKTTNKKIELGYKYADYQGGGGKEFLEPIANPKLNKLPPMLKQMINYLDSDAKFTTPDPIPLSQTTSSVDVIGTNPGDKKAIWDQAIVRLCTKGDQPDTGNVRVHIDSELCFGERLFVIVTQGAGIMQFSRSLSDNNPVEVPMSKGVALRLEGPARHSWFHKPITTSVEQRLSTSVREAKPSMIKTVSMYNPFGLTPLVVQAPK